MCVLCVCACVRACVCVCTCSIAISCVLMLVMLFSGGRGNIPVDATRLSKSPHLQLLRDKSAEHKVGGRGREEKDRARAREPTLNKNLNFLHAVLKDICPVLHLSCRGWGEMPCTCRKYEWHLALSFTCHTYKKFRFSSSAKDCRVGGKPDRTCPGGVANLGCCPLTCTYVRHCQHCLSGRTTQKPMVPDGPAELVEPVQPVNSVLYVHESERMQSGCQFGLEAGNASLTPRPPQTPIPALDSNPIRPIGNSLKKQKLCTEA